MQHKRTPSGSSMVSSDSADDQRSVEPFQSAESSEENSQQKKHREFTQKEIEEFEKKEKDQKAMKQEFDQIGNEILMYSDVLSKLLAFHHQIKIHHSELNKQIASTSQTHKNYKNHPTISSLAKTEESLSQMREALFAVLNKQADKIKTDEARQTLYRFIFEFALSFTKEKRLSEVEIQNFPNQYENILKMIASFQKNELIDIQLNLYRAKELISKKEKVEHLIQVFEKAKSEKEKTDAIQKLKAAQEALGFSLGLEQTLAITLAKREELEPPQKKEPLWKAQLQPSDNKLSKEDKAKLALQKKDDFKLLWGKTGVAERCGGRSKQEDAFQLSYEPANLFFFETMPEFKKEEQEKLSRIALMNAAAVMHKKCNDMYGKKEGGSTALTVLDRKEDKKVRYITTYQGDSSAYTVIVNRRTNKFYCRRLNPTLHNPVKDSPEYKRIEAKLTNKVFVDGKHFGSPGVPYLGAEFDIVYTNSQKEQITERNLKGAQNTRSFGDWWVDKLGLCRRPQTEIHEIELKDDEEAYTVLVCDGVGEPAEHHRTTLLDVSSQEVKRFAEKNYVDRSGSPHERDIGTLVAYGVLNGKSPDDIALSLVNAAIDAKSNDNCTAIVGRVESIASKKDLYDGHGETRVFADLLANDYNTILAEEVYALKELLATKGYGCLKDFDPTTGQVIPYKVERSQLATFPNTDAKIQEHLDKLAENARRQRISAKAVAEKARGQQRAKEQPTKTPAPTSAAQKQTQAPTPAAKKRH